MRIWIDIKNSHEPKLFNSLIKELNYDFFITARKYAEITKLLEKYRMKYKKVSGLHAKSKILKVIFLMDRCLRLYFTVPPFDFSLSHGSIYSIIVTRWRKRQSITITDNDFFNKVNKIIFETSDYMIVPKAVNYEQFNTKTVFTFNGFKEDIYIADFDPKKCKKEIPFKNYILLRPEAYKAYYLEGSFKSLVEPLVERLRREGFKIVLLPRYQEERKKYAGMKGVYIPPNPVDGLCAVWYARAVLTGSGTMAREAACLGVPAVSFFPSNNLLSVDRAMIKKGWLFHSRDVDEIIEYVFSKKKRKVSLGRSKRVKRKVVKLIKKIVEGEV